MTDAGHRPPTRRRGRPARADRSGGPDTREQIITAARRNFAEHGYDRASVRGIARTAGVDSALVHHYFGTKDQVFAAAVADAASPLAAALRALPETEPHLLGVRLTRIFLSVWENPETRGPILAVARSAFTNDTAARIFRGFLSEHLAQHITVRLATPDALLRVQLAVAQLVGSVVIRHLLRFEPLASAPFDEVVASLAPVVQLHLTGPPPSPDASATPREEDRGEDRGEDGVRPDGGPAEGGRPPRGGRPPGGEPTPSGGADTD